MVSWMGLSETSSPPVFLTCSGRFDPPLLDKHRRGIGKSQSKWKLFLLTSFSAMMRCFTASKEYTVYPQPPQPPASGINKWRWRTLVHCYVLNRIEGGKTLAAPTSPSPKRAFIASRLS
eukprot:COSAG01_NODE_14454_length_1451_cov_51.489645_2_plen_119_part_00